jgi:hypothetical protein
MKSSEMNSKMRAADLAQNFAKLPTTFGQMRPAKASKYHNERVVVDGIKFASKKEANYYSQLCLEMKAGTVLWFCRQPRFVLHGGVEFVADFIVIRAYCEYGTHNPTIEVIDVKGKRLPMYLLKLKQFKAAYPAATFRET